MESGKSAAFLLASTVAIFCIIGIGCVSGKPTMDQQWSSSQQQLMPSYEIHPIDNCIFACDHCFKGDALVKCANQCILSEATMSVEWTLTCPYLSRQYTHPTSNNPYRH